MIDHVGFDVRDYEASKSFYREAVAPLEAALAAGGVDNGPPGPRTLYHEHYYGAYVLDPDGNNLEAVCHAPP